VIARALAALHARPDGAWTIGSPSSSVSRRRLFDPARIDLAARRLKDTTGPVEEMARSVGYGSEYAFNRALGRHRGQPPGWYRGAA
jgi:transcriptional regulator GlxA family with amidase domain